MFMIFAFCFMGQAVYQGIDQDLVWDNFVPPTEGEVSGDDCTWHLQ